MKGGEKSMYGGRDCWLFTRLSETLASLGLIGFELIPQKSYFRPFFMDVTVATMAFSCHGNYFSVQSLTP